MTEDSKNIIEQDLNKAINFLGQNKFSEAESICNDIIKEKNNSDAYHILSSIKLYKQEFNESIELVNKSIEINSENPGYYVTLGCAHSASKDYKNSDAIIVSNNTQFREIKKNFNGRLFKSHLWVNIPKINISKSKIKKNLNISFKVIVF